MSAAAPSWTMLPLAHVAAVADLAAWLDGAGPGARCLFAAGVVEPRHHESWRWVADMAARGLVTVTARRPDASSRRREWLLVRTADADGSGDGAARARGPSAATVADEARMMALLKSCVAPGVISPLASNAALARACGFRNRDRARFILDRLATAGRIIVTGHGPHQPRTVCWREDAA